MGRNRKTSKDRAATAEAKAEREYLSQHHGDEFDEQVADAIVAPMHQISEAAKHPTYWCPRCGTLKSYQFADEADSA